MSRAPLAKVSANCAVLPLGLPLEIIKIFAMPNLLAFSVVLVYNELRDRLHSFVDQQQVEDDHSWLVEVLPLCQ